ncbi:MAG: hypothetical protein N2654_03250 [Deltaproteobacteria bacterium]|nr:hypothetical protein [Deltaproteobacteria bacterium]
MIPLYPVLLQRQNSTARSLSLGDVSLSKVILDYLHLFLNEDPLIHELSVVKYLPLLSDPTVSILSSHNQTLVLLGEKHARCSEEYIFTQGLLLFALPGILFLEGPTPKFIHEECQRLSKELTKNINLDLSINFERAMERFDMSRLNARFTSLLPLNSRILRTSYEPFVLLDTLIGDYINFDAEGVLHSPIQLIKDTAPLIWDLLSTGVVCVNSSDTVQAETNLIRLEDLANRFINEVSSCISANWVTKGWDRYFSISLELLPTKLREARSNLVREVLDVARSISSGNRQVDSVLLNLTRRYLTNILHFCRVGKNNLVFCLPILNEFIPKPMYFLEEEFCGLVEEGNEDYRQLVSTFSVVLISTEFVGLIEDTEKKQELLRIIEDNKENAVRCIRLRDYHIAKTIDGFSNFFHKVNDSLHFCYTALVGAAHVPGIREDLLNQGWDVVADFSVYEANSPKVKIYNQERFELLEREFLRRLALLGRS